MEKLVSWLRILAKSGSVGKVIWKAGFRPGTQSLQSGTIATYLAAIEHLDASIGRLLAALDETGQRENTFVLFLSDNGGVDTALTIPGMSGDRLEMSAKLHAWLASIPATVPGENLHFDPARMLEETKEKQAWNP